VAEREKGQVRTVAFSPNDAFVVSGTDAAVGVWDVEHGKLTEVRSGHTSPVIGIAFDQAGHIFSADTGGHIRVWPGFSAMTRVPGSVSAAEDFVQSADGSVAGVAQTDGGVSVVRLTDLRETVLRLGTRQLAAANRPRSLAITPDARHLLVGETDAVATVRVWDLRSNTSTVMPTLTDGRCAPLVRTDPPSFYVSKMATSPDGRTVAYGQGRCVIVRDLLTKDFRESLPVRPLKLVFRPDGSLLVISREDQLATGATKALIWDWQKNMVRAQRAIPLLDDFVDAAMSANGRTVAFLVNPTANLVSIWDGDLQGEISRLPVPPGTQRVALSSGGDRLVSAGRDNAVRIWDVAHRQLLLILPDDDQHSGGLAFTADGRLIAARSSGGLTIWETKPRDFPRAR
jgi:WD40 repeat protein